MSTIKRLIYKYGYLSVLLLSCSTDKVQTRYDQEGVITRQQFIWRSSLSDGALGQNLYLGFTYNQNSILCELKKEADPQNIRWKSSITLKDSKTGDNKWVWDEFYDQTLIRTLNDDIVIENDKIWIHDLMADYCIDARDGKTIWKTLRTFPSYSEACNIGDQYFFTSYGLNSRQKGNLADSFFKYLPNGQGFIEIGQPPYNDQFAFDNGLGYYIGSLKEIFAFKNKNTEFIVVPYVERGPPTGSSPNYNPNMTFFGLYNLTENRWVYDRVPLSLAYEGGILSLKPIVIENKVFLTSATWVYCFDVLTGEKIWEKRLTYDNSAPLDMIWADNRLVLNFFNAKLYCVDAQTGNLLWTQKSSGISSDLYHQNGVVYWIPSKNLRAVDLETGKLLWDMPSIDQVQEPGSESVWWGFVTGIPGKNEKKGKIFATSDHYLYCFEAIR